MGFRPDGNQVERHGRTHSMASSSNNSSGRSHGGIGSRCFVSRFFFWSGNISRAWGSGLVIVGGVFVEMNDEFVLRIADGYTYLSIEIIILIELFEVYYLRPG